MFFRKANLGHKISVSKMNSNFITLIINQVNIHTSPSHNLAGYLFLMSQGVCQSCRGACWKASSLESPLHLGSSIIIYLPTMEK